jgi:hypothetical protein
VSEEGFDDKFSMEESAALLRVIFPAYPVLLPTKPAPDLAEFLRELRSRNPDPPPRELRAGPPRVEG